MFLIVKVLTTKYVSKRVSKGVSKKAREWVSV